MPTLYSLIHDHVLSAQKIDREELGVYSSPAVADRVRQWAAALPGFDEQPDNFAVLSFRLDDDAGGGPVPDVCFSLCYDDGTPKTLGVYSTAIKAAEALVCRLQEPAYADHPSCFSILSHTIDVTAQTEGYAMPTGV